jgi:hypothetical protein
MLSTSRSEVGDQRAYAVPRRKAFALWTRLVAPVERSLR